jgi:hypothetical protein
MDESQSASSILKKCGKKEAASKLESGSIGEVVVIIIHVVKADYISMCQITRLNAFILDKK